MATYSTGQIARKLGVNVSRVEYILETRKIEPLGRVGFNRFFGQVAFDLIAAELRKIADKRKGANHD